MQNIKNLKYLGLALAGVPAVAAAQTQAAKPNIIVILADDMGYSDLGCYGGEIETPVLNSLAENGLRWRQFYNNARSCPSRAVLMTGLYPHQAGMGWMAAADLQRPSVQGSLNNNCMTIAEVLKTAGYRTYMTGKWHLSSDRQNNGGVKDNWPMQRGFDRFYGIPGGASNYFNTTMTNDNDQAKTGEDFYFTHSISDSAAMFVARHDYRAEPLFLYLSYTAPHWPLHALQTDIDKYVERYKAGWDNLRAERFARQQKMGLFNNSAVMSPRDEAVEAWDALQPDQQHKYAMRMAIYAAQIDAMDQGIGRVVDALKKTGQFENTIIMFMSDNGACAEFISSGKRKDVDGREDTFESYRINWANVSSTPYREYKHFTNEGGIATPLIVSYPNGIAKGRNGNFVSEYGYFADIMATCVDLAGANYPAKFKGENIVPMQGVSLAPNFAGEPTGRGLNFWEHEANIAVRDGKWKLVSKVPEGTDYNDAHLELYDMEADPTEMNDLSEHDPQRVEKMYAEWRKWGEKVGVFPLDTRFYNARQSAYKRVINGEFNENFGHWALRSPRSGGVAYSIDTENVISGSRTARIDIEEKGSRPEEAYMRWVFPLDEASDLSVGFRYESDTDREIVVRVEDADKPENKVFDQRVKLSKKGGKYYFKKLNLPKKGRYQMSFNFGNTEPGTIWIDDVKLDFVE